LRAAGEVRAPQFGHAEGDIDAEMWQSRLRSSGSGRVISTRVPTAIVIRRRACGGFETPGFSKPSVSIRANSVSKTRSRQPKGGFIRGDDHRDIFCHVSVLQKAGIAAVLAAGDRVSLRLRSGCGRAAAHHQARPFADDRRRASRVLCLPSMTDAFE
jgi:cold shock CspA family protein